jgi:hypothetical protein
MPKQPAPIIVPPELTGVKPEELTRLEQGILARLDELGAAEDPTEEEVDEINKLVDDVDRIRAEQTERDEQKADRRARRDEALTRARGDLPAEDDEVDEVEGEDDGLEDDDGLGEVEPVEGEGEQQPIAASARRRNAGALNTRRPARARPKPSRSSNWHGGTTVFAGAQVPDMVAGAEFSNVMQIATAISKRRNAMGHFAGTREYQTIATGKKIIRDQDFVPVLGQDAVENFGVVRELQTRLAKASREKAGTRAVVASAGVSDLEDYTPALVASGACCTPLSPMYDFFRIAVPQTPIEDATATVQAPRGGIRFIVPPDYQRLLAAVGVQNCAQNADPNNPEIKPCLHVDCPQIDEQTVDAISTCITFGNLQYKSFPEQVAAFLEDLAVAFATTKEIGYLNTIDAASTAVTSDTAYGAFRALLFDLVLSATGYRKRHGMPRNSVLQVLLPDWSIDLLKADLINDGYEGLQWINVPDSDVIAALQSRNLDPVFYNDSAMRATSVTSAGTTSAALSTSGPITAIPVNALGATVPAGIVTLTIASGTGAGNTQTFVTSGAASAATSIPVTSTVPNFAYASGTTVNTAVVGANQKFNQVQAAGALNQWPGEVVWYMYAPGSFVRMDGGTLDVGLVRDSVLNRTNDLQIFNEEWTGMVFLGLESIKGTSTVCPSGSGALGSTPITCSSSTDIGASSLMPFVGADPGTTRQAAGQD